MGTDLFACVDPWGRRITLTESQWFDHILVRHAELTPYRTAIERVLIAPTRLMSDTQYRERRNDYRENVLPAPLDRLYLKVCVEFKVLGVAVGEPILGRVVTAYPLPTVKRGEVQLWP